MKEPGARADVQACGMVVRRGTVRTARLYSDFVFRFEFRPSSRQLKGAFFCVHDSARTGASERGYHVALTN